MREVIFYRKEPFVRILEDAMPMKASVKQSAQNMEHPVADGTVVTDHRIIRPIEVSIPVVLSRDTYGDTIEDIQALFRAGTLFTLATRTGFFTDMMLTDIPSDETPEMFDTVTVTLNFKQVVFTRPQFGKLQPQQVAAAKNASTVERGQVKPSLLSRGIASIRGFFP